MYDKICPVCKNKFYGDNKYFGNHFVRHNDCVVKKKRKEKKERRPARTSTPISDKEYNSVPSFSDSVTDFFYQSWKSGLHSHETSRKQFNQWNQQPSAILQPVCYTPQVIYVNTVIYQPYMPTSYVQVGYRPDGTFGVLPNYWTYGAN